MRLAPIVMVPVKVRGGRGGAAVDMALDTGATLCVIPPDVAEAVGATPAPDARSVRVWSATSVERKPVVRLRDISAMGVQLHDVAAVCHELPEGSRVDGLLGLSFLRHLNLDLHFRANRLRAWYPAADP